MSFIRIVILSIPTAIVASWAQATAIRGPVAGIVYDSGTRGVRPILGVPGAAVLGASIVDDLDSADIAPNGKWGVGLRHGRLVYFAGLDTANITTVSLGEHELWTLAAWSANSKAAALYSAKARELLLATGLDQTPQITSLDISAISGEIRFVLVEGTAETVVLGVQGSGVYLVDRSNTPKLLAGLHDPVAATFLRAGRDIAIADTGTRQILELLDFQSAAALAPFADLPEGADPVGLGLSANRLFVADRSSSSVAVFDLTSRQLEDNLKTDTPLTIFKVIGRQSVFQLGADPDSLFVLDGDRAAVYYIPGCNHP